MVRMEEIARRAPKRAAARIPPAGLKQALFGQRLKEGANLGLQVSGNLTDRLRRASSIRSRASFFTSISMGWTSHPEFMAWSLLLPYVLGEVTP